MNPILLKVGDWKWTAMKGDSNKCLRSVRDPPAVAASNHCLMTVAKNVVDRHINVAEFTRRIRVGMLLTSRRRV